MRVPEWKELQLVDKQCTTQTLPLSTQNILHIFMKQCCTAICYHKVKQGQLGAQQANVCNWTDKSWINKHAPLNSLTLIPWLPTVSNTSPVWLIAHDCNHSIYGSFYFDQLYHLVQFRSAKVHRNSRIICVCKFKHASWCLDKPCSAVQFSDDDGNRTMTTSLEWCWQWIPKKTDRDKQ